MLRAQDVKPSTSRGVEIPSLYAELEQIPDARQASGKRHPLAAMLGLACVALLCGYRSPYAIAEWINNYGTPYLQRFGFTRTTPPAQATWYRVLGQIDREELQRRLADWAQRVLVALCGAVQLQGLAIDGKTLRGSQKQGAQDTHLLSAVCHQLGLSLGQVAVADKTNEIGAVLDLLSLLILRGCVVTTDALLTQQKVAHKVLQAGGDYVFIVKQNQPTLYADIQLLFNSPPPILKGQAWPQASTCDKGHGRLEIRRLQATTALNAYLQWPGVQQVFQLQRQVTRNGQCTSETVYGLTSLTPERATPAQLLTFIREHWHVENKSHWVRDVTFDEDRSQVRRDNLPHVMAAIRNAVITLLRAIGITNIAQALRFFAAQPEHALALVGIPSGE